MRVSDLTVDELRALIRSVVREALHEEQANVTPQQTTRKPQAAILDIPSLHLDPRHPALAMPSREEMYGDDGR